MIGFRFGKMNGTTVISGASSNAEHLAMSENAGMINLSHFAVYDITGPDAEMLMEYVCVAKVGGNTAIGKGNLYSLFGSKWEAFALTSP